MRVLSVRTLTVVLTGIGVSGLVLACSSSSNGGDGFEVVEASTADHAEQPEPDSGSAMVDMDATKPKPSEMDAGGAITDAAPTSRPDASKPKGAGDAGKLVDAGLGDATIPITGTGDPLDPIDESLMPTYGLDEGTCATFDLTDSTGRCFNGPFSGDDYVEGCTGGETYLFDCARYDSAGSTRSICQDDFTTVGCVLIDQGQVASFEASQTASYLDQFHACPTSWEGYGYCDGDFISICQGQEDYWLDCGIYNSGPFTYTCGTDTDGHIACL